MRKRKALNLSVRLVVSTIALWLNFSGRLVEVTGNLLLRKKKYQHFSRDVFSFLVNITLLSD